MCICLPPLPLDSYPPTLTLHQTETMGIDFIPLGSKFSPLDDRCPNGAAFTWPSAALHRVRTTPGQGAPGQGGHGHLATASTLAPAYWPACWHHKVDNLPAQGSQQDRVALWALLIAIAQAIQFSTKQCTAWGTGLLRSMLLGARGKEALKIAKLSAQDIEKNSTPS